MEVYFTKLDITAYLATSRAMDVGCVCKCIINSEARHAVLSIRTSCDEDSIFAERIDHANIRAKLHILVGSAFPMDVDQLTYMETAM